MEQRVQPPREPQIAVPSKLRGIPLSDKNQKETKRRINITAHDSTLNKPLTKRVKFFSHDNSTKEELIRNFMGEMAANSSQLRVPVALQRSSQQFVSSSRANSKKFSTIDNNKSAGENWRLFRLPDGSLSFFEMFALVSNIMVISTILLVILFSCAKSRRKKRIGKNKTTSQSATVANSLLSTAGTMGQAGEFANEPTAVAVNANSNLNNQPGEGDGTTNDDKLAGSQEISSSHVISSEFSGNASSQNNNKATAIVQPTQDGDRANPGEDVGQPTSDSEKAKAFARDGNLQNFNGGSVPNLSQMDEQADGRKSRASENNQPDEIARSTRSLNSIELASKPDQLTNEQNVVIEMQAREDLPEQPAEVSAAMAAAADKGKLIMNKDKTSSWISFDERSPVAIRQQIVGNATVDSKTDKGQENPATAPPSIPIEAEVIKRIEDIESPELPAEEETPKQIDCSPKRGEDDFMISDRLKHFSSDDGNNRKYFVYIVNDGHFTSKKECIARLELPQNKRITLSELRHMITNSRDVSMQSLKRSKFKFVTETYRLLNENEDATILHQVYPTQGVFVKLNYEQMPGGSGEQHHFQRLSLSSQAPGGSRRARSSYQDSGGAGAEEAQYLPAIEVSNVEQQAGSAPKQLNRISSKARPAKPLGLYRRTDRPGLPKIAPAKLTRAAQ